MPPTSAAMELKVLISIMQSGQALQNMLGQVNQLSTALNKLQTQAAGGGPVVPPTPPIAPALKGGKEAADATAKAMEGLEKNINKVVSAVRFLTGGFLALQSVRFLKSLADVAAQNQVLGTVLHVVAQNAGIMAEDIDKVDKKVQSLGITVAASRQALTQFLQARLELKFAPALARAAQDLAVISGVNSSDTFKRLIVNIQQLDTLGLRMQGLVVDRTVAERKYKEEIGATNRELNKREQQTALMIGVLEKAKGLEGTYSSAMNDVAKQLTSLERLTETYRGILGEQLLPAYSAIVAEITAMFEKLTVLAAEFNSNKERAEGLANAARELTQVFTGLAVFLMEHLEAIIKLVKWYVEFKAILFLLKGAGSMLLWMVTAVDWILKLRLAFQALQTGMVSFRVVLQALGAASVAETGKLLQLAIAQERLAVAGAAARTSLQATGTAASLAGAQVGALAAGWTTLGSLLLIPIVGTIIIRMLKQIEEEGKEPLLQRAAAARERQMAGPAGAASSFAAQQVEEYFQTWKRLNPELVMMLKTDEALFAEFNRRIEYATKKQAFSGLIQELKEAKQARQEALTEQEQLLHPPEGGAKPSPAERFAARTKFEDAAKAVTEIETKINKAFEAIPGTASTRAVNAQIDKVKELTAALGKVREKVGVTTAEILQAEATLDVAKAEKDAMIKKLPSELEKEIPKDPGRRADLLAITQMKGDITATADSAQALSDATQQIFGGKFEFKPEGVASKAFGTALGGYQTLITEANKMIEQEGDIPVEFADRLRKGLENLGEQAKTPLDLKNLKSIGTELQKLEKQAPGVGVKLKQAISVAELGVQKEGLSFLAPLEAKQKERLKLQADTEQEAQKHRLNTIRTQGQFANEEQQKLYTQGLVGLQEYFAGRREVIERDGAEEVRLQELNIEELRKQQAATRDPDQRRALGIQVTAAVEQKRNILQRTELELEKLRNQEIDTRIKLEKEVASSTYALTAQYGGQEEAVAQLNFQLEEEAKKYRASNIVGYEYYLLLKQQAGMYEILNKARERAYQLQLGEINAQKEQVDLAEKRRSVEAAQIEAAVKGGTLSEAGAMRLRNEQAFTAMQENRQRRAIAEAELEFNTLERAKELNQIFQARRDNILSADEAIKRTQETQQKWDTILAGNEQALIDLDAAMVTLAGNIETYGKRIKEKFVDSFADALTQTIMHVRNAGEIWKAMANQITAEIIGIFTKAFSQKLFAKMSFGFIDRILGTGGGIRPSFQGDASVGPVTAAEGGLVSGPGTGTSDSVIARVSAGEHIMPAAKTARYLSLLEGIRLGTIVPAYALGGVVALQSIAMPSIIPRRYASGGVVVSDGGAGAVQTGGGTGNMVVTMHPDTLNMTMREWLEHEVTRQYGRR